MRLSSRPNVERLKARTDVDGLIRALGYRRDARVLQEAVDALVDIGKPAVRPLVDALNNLPARDGAIDALVQLGSLAIDPLVLALRHRGAGVRGAASNALAQIGMLAVDPLVVALRHKSWSAREAAINALVQIGYLAEEPLMTVFLDKREQTYVRQAAAEALVHLGKIDVVLGILRTEYGDMRKALVEVLGRSDNSLAADPLIALLSDNEALLRQSAATALGQLGSRRVVGELASALKRERDPNVRTAITEALQTLGWKPKRPQPKEKSKVWKNGKSPFGQRDSGVVSIVPAYGWSRILELLPKLKPVRLRPLDEIIRMSPANTRVKAFTEPQEIVRDLSLEFADYSRFRDLQFTGNYIKAVFDDRVDMGTESVPATRQLEITLVYNGDKFIISYTLAFLASSGWSRILEFLTRLKPSQREAIIKLRAQNMDVRAFSEPIKVVQDIQHESDTYPRLKTIKYDDRAVTLTFDNYTKRGSDVVPPTKQLEAIIATDGTKFFVFYTSAFVELW